MPTDTRTASNVIAIASHQVRDYAAWRAVYDAGRDLRDRMGVKDAEVFVDPQDGNKVVVVTRFATLADMDAFTANPELKASMEHAGVILPRTIVVGMKP
jgi:heme-degrading monooxygenase HmoA